MMKPALIKTADLIAIAAGWMMGTKAINSDAGWLLASAILCLIAGAILPWIFIRYPLNSKDLGVVAWGGVILIPGMMALGVLLHLLAGLLLFWPQGFAINRLGFTAMVFGTIGISTTGDSILRRQAGDANC